MKSGNIWTEFQYENKAVFKCALFVHECGTYFVLSNFVSKLYLRLKVMNKPVKAI